MADLFIIGQFEGVAGTTAVSIGSQVMHMLTVMIVGLAMGSTVSIAKAIGANDKKEVSRSIGNTVTLFMLVAAGLMVILIFAGVHFSFSGYFCACGRSELSFLHNITAIVLVRVPGVYLTSKLFPQTLLPMGLATAAGSLLSVIICVTAYLLIFKKVRRK